MNLALLISFTKQDFVERYSGSILGLAWAIIWPLVMIAIYTVIFANIMGARLPGVSSMYGYSIYLVAGLIPWTAFANTVSRATTVFIDKKSIITKVKVLLPHLPLYIVLSESVTFVITLAIYLVFLISTGTSLSKSLILLPFIYLVQQIFAYGLGLFFGIFNVFIRDIKELVGVLIQIWFWLTPIVYVVNIVPEHVQTLLQYNPAYIFIKAYQDIFVFGSVPNLSALMSLVLIAHGMLVVAYLILKLLEKDVRDFI